MKDPQTNVVQQQNTTLSYPTNNVVSTSFAPESADNGATTYLYGINGSLRKKATAQKTEYYLFNAFDQMKAYSDDGITYGYYGYDANGERMYKVQLSDITAQTNAFGGKFLEVEKMTLYPNGYINIDQYGNYTKHYYADAMRIASKIGTGLSDSISRGEVENDYILEVMQNELGLVTYDTITSIDCSFEQITHLQGDSCKFENELYFYHGDHLSSTQMITDANGSVQQQVLYAPFGEVISEYNAYWHQGKVPDYMFNAKEKDEESGMYYYSARYYAPPVFISRDPLFEKYPFMSPYAYCENNPLKYVDPDGQEAIETEITNITWQNTEFANDNFSQNIGEDYSKYPQSENSQNRNFQQQPKPQTLQQQLASTLSSLEIGKDISGKKLGDALGNSDISLAISKITRKDENTFDITRTLFGCAALKKGSTMTIEKGTIPIDGKTESAFKVTIKGYENWIIEQGALPVFYINKNNIYYYGNDGKLYKGSTEKTEKTEK
jgi:RHS repeat-associated protein